MSNTAKNYLYDILVSLPPNFTIQVGQYTANKKYLLDFLNSIKGPFQQSIDNAPVRSGKSGSDAAREKSYNEINQHALRQMMTTPVVQQGGPALGNVLSAYLEILNMQTGHIGLSLVREQGIGESRVFHDPTPNKTFSSKRVQPGDGSPGCVLLSDLLIHKDQIHDAFDDNRNKQDARGQRMAKERVLSMIKKLKVRATDIRYSLSTRTSSLEEQMSLDTFDLFYEHFVDAVTNNDPDGVITNGKVKAILRKVCESSKSILQYYSVVSFFMDHGSGLYEQGIFISADRDKDAWMKCQEVYPKAINPSDRGASETFCILQTQPIFLKKLQKIFRIASKNANKTVILSSFINNQGIKKRNEIKTEVNALRENNTRRESCCELDSFEIPTYRDYKSSLTVTNEFDKRAIQSTYAAQQGATIQSERERALEKRFRKYQQEAAITKKLFPIDCQVLQDLNTQTPIIHLDQSQIVFCETFLGLDMHAAQNPTGSSLNNRMAAYDLNMSFPTNNTNVLVGPTTGVGHLGPATVMTKDMAGSIFRAGMSEIEMAVGVASSRRIGEGGRHRTMSTSIKSVSSNQSGHTLPPPHINCQGILQLASLGVFSQSVDYPIVSGTAMPRNVKLHLKENPTTGNMNTDFIPVFVGTNTANALTGLMGVRKGGCGKEEFKNTNSCASNTGCACMNFVEDKGTHYQDYMDCWSQQHSVLSEKQKRDIKKAEISWCPCHGAYISNILAVIKDSPDLHQTLSAIANAAGDLSILKSFVDREPNDIVGVKIAIPKGKAENLIYAANPDKFGRGKYRKTEVGQFVLNEIQHGRIVSTQLGDGRNGTWSFEDEKYYFTFQDHLNEQLKKSANGEDLVPLDGINISGPRLAGAWQQHLIASGTLPQDGGGSFKTAEKLDSLGENGLGICCTTCMCGGLCIGNKLWAALGIYTLIDIKLAHGDDAGEFIRNNKQTIGLPIAALITCVTQMSGSGSTLGTHFQHLLSVAHPYLNTPKRLDIDADSIWTFALTALLPLLESETNKQSTEAILRRRTEVSKEKRTFTVVRVGKPSDNDGNVQLQVKGQGFYGQPITFDVGTSELGRDEDEEYLYTVDDDGHIADRGGLSKTQDATIIIPANILSEKTKNPAWMDEEDQLDKAIAIHDRPIVDTIGSAVRDILGKQVQLKRADLVTFTDTKFKDALRRSLSGIEMGGSYTSGNTDQVDFYMYTGHDVCNTETLGIMEQTQCRTPGVAGCKKGKTNKRTIGTKTEKKQEQMNSPPSTIWGLVNYIIYELNETTTFPKAIIAESNPAVVAAVETMKQGRNLDRFNLSLDQGVKLNSFGASSLGPIIEIISLMDTPPGVPTNLWSVAADLAIQSLLSIKTYGDLHALLLSLQISRTDEFMPATIVYMTGDFMGTALAATFKDEQGNLPLICMSAKSTETNKGKLPMHFLPMALFKEPSVEDLEQAGYFKGKRRSVNVQARAPLSIRVPRPRIRTSVRGTPLGVLHSTESIHPSEIHRMPGIIEGGIGSLSGSSKKKLKTHIRFSSSDEDEEDNEGDTRMGNTANEMGQHPELDTFTSELHEEMGNTANEMGNDDNETGNTANEMGNDDNDTSMDMLPEELGEEDEMKGGGKGLFSSALGKGGSRKRRHRRRKTRRKKKRRKRKSIKKRRKRGRKTRRK